MTPMRIFIPTLNRGPLKQYTIRELGPLAKKYRATLVCPASERRQFEAAGFECVSPTGVKGICATRQWILENSDDPHILMLDDDLSSWSWRVEVNGDSNEPGRVQYAKATPKNRADGLAQVQRLLNKYGHGSIGHRLFANNRPALGTNGRQLRALAYDRDVLAKEKIKFRLPVMEDFDVQLQMLKRGHTCFQVNTLVQEQRGSNVEGGCSTYRTHKVQEDAAIRLAQLHPDCVTVVEKKLNKGWGGDMGQERIDVRVSWRNAIRIGMEYKHGNARSVVLLSRW